ncbi:MAG: nfdA 1 [Clostridia bacterium]|jgi:predicted amidohydrolase YtcJ|nr:nfdA 1 [Clostridia bacterium]
MNFDFSYVDTAFKNGVVVTVNDKDETAQAVGIKGNKIVFVGSNHDLESIIDSKTKVIDLKGRALLPGLIDSHYHPILSGFFGDDPDSSIVNVGWKDCKCIDDIINKLKESIAVKKPGEWVSMMGYDPTKLKEDRHPNIKDLDAVSPDNPVQCMHYGGHVCVYNTRALEILGVFCPEDANKFPKDEVEVIDGKLTGMVRDHTHFSLWAKVDYSPKQQESAAMKAQKHLLENGITSIHDCGECDGPSYHIMQKLCRERKFRVRSYMMLHSIYGKPFSLDDNNHYLSLGLTSGLGDEHFRIGSCKFMIDGGSSAPSCAMREPYSHDPDLPGIMGWERHEISDYIKLINDAGCQATAHAIGDLAIECMVEGYEKAFETNFRPDLRHRIEHCTVVDQNLIDRMAKMNICPTLNPGMIQVGGKNYGRFFGERSKYTIALKSMLEAGMKPSIASDTPSGPAGIQVIDGAVNRYDRTNDFELDQTQAITVIEAIRCATYNGAYASYEENIKGSIEVGKLADMIVLSEDITFIPKRRINEIKVDITMIDGIIEYER